MDVVVKRFEIYLVNLDPTVGGEINKLRPCVILSPIEMNRALQTVIIAPLTSTLRNYPSRVNCVVNKKTGQIALDQISTVDKTLLVKKIAVLDQPTGRLVLENLIEIFS